MKAKSLFLSSVSALSVLVSCQQQNIILPVDFHVALDESNTYYTGETVRFKITGDADYIVFYSGEEGHEYRYRDRTRIPKEEIRSVFLNLKMERLWGPQYSMDLYFAPNFAGLLGTDGEADRATMRQLVKDGLPGFQKLNFEELGHGVWAEHTYQIDSLVDRFCLAFHWKPYTINFTQCQATYHVRGDITLNFGDKGVVKTDLADVDFKTIVMNEQDPPYLVGHRGDSTNIGTMHFDGTQYAINFEGTSQTYLTYEIDDWCISVPGPLNSIHKDTGTQIKSMMNSIFEYDYVFTEPGSYKVTFVGVNDNYQGHETGIQEFSIFVMDRPTQAK